jgi:hypothetical protein
MAKDVTAQVMTITPRMAAGWLEHNCPRNRKLRRAKVEQYAADMRAGRWRLSDQAISFDCRGDLVNGQHRLQAVVAADTPVAALVVRNLPAEAMMVLDGGMRRTTDDNLAIAGRAYPKQCGPTVRRLLAGARAFYAAITDQEVDAFLAVHHEAVAFAHRAVPAGKFGSASIRAAVARAAILGRDRARLERFGEVLTTGLMTPGDEAAVLLRNHVFDAATSYGGRDRLALYLKAEAALDAYLRGDRARKLPDAKGELFPIPGIDLPPEDAAPAVVVLKAKVRPA